MPTQRLFDRLPPFPPDIKTVDLPEISYAKLQADNNVESRRLLDASRTAGFIALKLDDCPEGQALLETSEKIFELDEKVHEIPPEEMEPFKFQPPQVLYGYKVRGITKLEDGRDDNVVYFNIGRDEVLGVTPKRANPPLIEQNRALVETFYRQAHPAIQAIFRHLETNLHLEPGILDSMNAFDEPSASHLRLLKTCASSEPARLNLLGHTDMGTITLLFNVVGGLQILPPGGSKDNPDDWKYVKPRPGYAVINIADALVEWSGGILRSNMHRVVTAPGQQETVDRYSVGYFVRPTAEALIKRLDSKVIPVASAQNEDSQVLTAREWETWRAEGFMKGKNMVASIGGGPMVEIDVGGAQ